MEHDQRISREKVIDEFDRRARVHGNLNAVLDAGNRPGVRRQNILRDYITRHRLISLLKPRQHDAVLDFGCGMGRLANVLSPRVGKIAGVDISEAMLNLAIENSAGFSNTEFKRIENSSIPYPDQSFTKAFTVWVLQHIDERELVNIAAELFRVLKPRGELILLEQIREQSTLLSDIHIQRSRADYLRIFTEAGFTAIKGKAALRVPSYAMSVWNKYGFISRFWLPLLYLIESITLKYKPVNVQYYTWSFVFKKQ